MVSSFLSLVWFIGSACYLLVSSYSIVGGIGFWKGRSLGGRIEVAALNGLTCVLTSKNASFYDFDTHGERQHAKFQPTTLTGLAVHKGPTGVQNVYNKGNLRYSIYT